MNSEFSIILTFLTVLLCYFLADLTGTPIDGKKKFCSNCSHCSDSAYCYADAEATTQIDYLGIRSTTKGVRSCMLRNKKNNCKKYIRKWYKFRAVK